MREDKCLILRARPGSEALAIAETLQQIAAETDTGTQIQVCSDADTARTMLRADETATLCQIYTAPERFLCRAVDQGQDLASALADWAGEAREMLALHRQNRPRSLLFEATHLCRYSDAGLARIGFSAGSVTLNAAIEDLPVKAPVLGLIAQTHLQARPDVVDLREELDVSAQLLSNDATLAPPLSAELALQSYHAQTLRQGWIGSTPEAIRNAAKGHAALHAYWAGRTHLEVSYDEMQQSPETVVEKIAGRLDIPLPSSERDRICQSLAGLKAPETKDGNLDHDETTLLHPGHRADKAERDAALRRIRAVLAERGL